MCFMAKKGPRQTPARPGGKEGVPLPTRPQNRGNRGGRGKMATEDLLYKTPGKIYPPRPLMAVKISPLNFGPCWGILGLWIGWKAEFIPLNYCACRQKRRRLPLFCVECWLNLYILTTIYCTKVERRPCQKKNPTISRENKKKASAEFPRNSLRLMMSSSWKRLSIECNTQEIGIIG